MKKLKLLLSDLRNFIRLNYNHTLQSEGVVHKSTRYPIEEEKAIQTMKQAWMYGWVRVTFKGGRTQSYNNLSWNYEGARILKDEIITEIDW